MRALAVLLALAATGCGGPRIQVHTSYHMQPPSAVAVLPFSAPDDDPATLEQVAFLRRTFHATFGELPFADLDLDAVDRLLRGHGIRGAADLEGHSAAELARILGVDGLIYGRVTDIRNIAPLLAYWRSVTGHIRLVSAAEEPVVLLEVEHTARARGGPLIESSQVIYGIINQVRNSTNLAFVELSERWSQQIVDRLPPPKRAAPTEVPTPRIHAVSVVPGRAGTLGAGDRLEATVSADAGLRIALELGDGRRLPLSEVASGQYRGSYRIQPGDRIAEAVSILATSRFGRTHRETLPATIAVDATRPPAPAELTVATGKPGGLALAWSATAGVRYRVWRASPDRPAAPRALGDVAAAAFSDAQADPQQAWLYQVAALDPTGRPGHPAAVRWAGGDR